MMKTIRELLATSDGIIGGFIIVGFAVTAIFAPFFAPYDPLEMHPSDRFCPPSSRYLAGTDQFGRDLLSRLIYGSRVSLCVAATSVLLAAFIGGLFGVSIGYLGGKFDLFLARLVDVLISLPPMILALCIVAFLGATIQNVIIALAFTYFPIFVRMARGEAIALKNTDFVQAARALGASHAWIILRHVMPSILPTMITQATLAFSWAILTEASLSYLGLGVPPPTPAWGSMLGEGQQFMLIAPWTAVFPGVIITVLVIGINLVGDRLRDVLDPHLRRR